MYGNSKYSSCHYIYTPYYWYFYWYSYSYVLKLSRNLDVTLYLIGFPPIAINGRSDAQLHISILHYVLTTIGAWDRVNVCVTTN